MSVLQNYLNAADISKDKKQKILDSQRLGISDEILEAAIRKNHGTRFDTLTIGDENSEEFIKQSSFDRGQAFKRGTKEEAKAGLSKVGKGLTRLGSAIGETVTLGTKDFGPEGRQFISRELLRTAAGGGKILESPIMGAFSAFEPEIQEGVEALFAEVDPNTKQAIGEGLAAIPDEAKSIFIDSLEALGLLGVGGILSAGFTRSTGKEIGEEVTQKAVKEVVEDSRPIEPKAELRVVPTDIRGRPLDTGPGTKPISELIDITSSIPDKKFTPTFRERMVGVRPDVKKRISGKTDQFDEFINVAKARNLDDTAPSALAHAANKTADTFNKIEKALDDTGTNIGRFRQKVATVKAAPDDIQNVIDVFDNEIAKKGLKVDKKRNLVRDPKRETTLEKGDITFLQNARDSLVRLKGDPTSLRIIDNRKVLDKKAQFGKKALEVSSEVDATAKAARAELARINQRIIGPEQAQFLADFEEIVKALDEFKALTSKGKNFEFLLKRVRSERDRLPKEAIERIKEITGDDIQDFATFGQLATELVGNQAQKGLFRQEIANAQLDVMSILNPKAGAVNFLLDKSKGVLFNPEDIFRQATILKKSD